MTYAKNVFAAAALLASVGAAHAADGAVNEHEAFYKALQTPAAATTVIEGRQAAPIATAPQAPVDRYLETRTSGSAR